MSERNPNCVQYDSCNMIIVQQYIPITLKQVRHSE